MKAKRNRRKKNTREMFFDKYRVGGKYLWPISNGRLENRKDLNL